MTEAAPPRLFLAKHLFSCVVDNQVVLLDLRKDRYFGLDPLQAHAFLSIFRGKSYSGQTITSQVKKDNPSQEMAINELLKNGILTESPFEGKEATSVTVDSPPLDLTGYDVTKERRIKLRHVLMLTRAALSTSLTMRLRSLQHAIHRVRKRKSRHLEASDRQFTNPSKDKERIRELVEIFRMIRLFLFTSKNYCLYDSIVLVKFLGAYGIYPDLVVGVKMKPFQAHAWVQDKDFIYNACNREIDLFTPIMVI